jgi:hypothetical protein
LYFFNFLTVPALLAWLEAQKLYSAAVTIITRVKSNYNAYEFLALCDSNKRKRGRLPKKGKDVKPQALFASQAEFFTQTELTMYGQKTAVSYLCKDLLWFIHLAFSMYLYCLLPAQRHWLLLFIDNEAQYTARRLPALRLNLALPLWLQGTG